MLVGSEYRTTKQSLSKRRIGALEGDYTKHVFETVNVS